MQPLSGENGSVLFRSVRLASYAQLAHWRNLPPCRTKWRAKFSHYQLLNELALQHRIAYHVLKHQERAGHAPTPPTEARENAHGGHSLRRLDAATDGRNRKPIMTGRQPYGPVGAKEPVLFSRSARASRATEGATSIAIERS
jgi:hypothetical protein